MNAPQDVDALVDHLPELPGKRNGRGNELRIRARLLLGFLIGRGFRSLGESLLRLVSGGVFVLRRHDVCSELEEFFLLTVRV